MSFIANICIAAIASALYKLLVPENKFTKQLSLLVICVFLLTGISAVFGADISVEPSAELSESADFISFSGEVNAALKNKVCSDMEEKIRALFDENGLSLEEVCIIVNISGLYSINITEVRVTLKEESRSETKKAEELLKKTLSDKIKTTVM